MHEAAVPAQAPFPFLQQRLHATRAPERSAGLGAVLGRRLQPLAASLSLSGLHRFAAQAQEAMAQGAAEADRQAAPAGPTTTGRWKRTGESDSLDEACRAVNLGLVLRNAVKLVKVVEIEEGATHFQTKLKAGPGGVLDVRERYPWSGEEVEHARRDKRRGVHHGRVERTPRGPKLTVKWGEPYGGELFDLYEVDADGQRLVQTTEMTMAAGGRVVVYRTVYRRLS